MYSPLKKFIPQDKRTYLKAVWFQNRSPHGYHFIHVGKCAGTTLLDSLSLAEHKRPYFYIHMVKPIVLPNARYVIAIRNPLSRFVSAFNHHRKSYLDASREWGDPEAIRQIFGKYETANELALDLTVNRQQLARQVFSIGHMKRGLNFYLGDLLKAVSSEQIEFVFVQEFLDEGIAYFCGTPVAQIHRDNGRASWHTTLSREAARNLQRFLQLDFHCIEKLHYMNKIGDQEAKLLLARPQRQATEY